MVETLWTKCKQDYCKVLTYSWLAGTKKHGYSVNWSTSTDFFCFSIRAFSFLFGPSIAFLFLLFLSLFHSLNPSFLQFHSLSMTFSLSLHRYFFLYLSGFPSMTFPFSFFLILSFSLILSFWFFLSFSLCHSTLPLSLSHSLHLSFFLSFFLYDPFLLPAMFDMFVRASEWLFCWSRLQ